MRYRQQKVKENHKFDNGKLVVSEERQVNLDITVPEQPRFKKGVYVETDTNMDKNVKSLVLDCLIKLKH